jgi:hypothetical protein
MGCGPSERGAVWRAERCGDAILHAQGRGARRDGGQGGVAPASDSARAVGLHPSLPEPAHEFGRDSRLALRHGPDRDRAVPVDVRRGLFFEGGRARAGCSRGSGLRSGRRTGKDQVGTAGACSRAWAVVGQGSSAAQRRWRLGKRRNQAEVQTPDPPDSGPSSGEGVRRRAIRPSGELGKVWAPAPGGIRGRESPAGFARSRGNQVIGVSDGSTRVFAAGCGRPG